jgi:BirA family biotin operon repressor/biotin-[acetyl-CoA-carboxylase] ligase
MDQRTLETNLADLNLGAIRYFGSVTSTNDLAIRWAQAGGPDLALVVSNEQTAGRGRGDRKWYTPPDSALAFSLVLRPLVSEECSNIQLFTALGALAVCETLNEAFPVMFPAQIKWPNDIVANRRKLAGILTEAQWQGDQLQSVVIGVGINVAPQSIPPAESIDFPATSVETVLGQNIDRWSMLNAVLTKMIELRTHIASPNFIKAWDLRLAFRGEWVYISQDSEPVRELQIAGLEENGALRVRDRTGDVHSLQVGEIRLRPPGSADE